MKKALIIGTVLGLLVYLTAMWITAEQAYDQSNKKVAEVSTDFDMLKSAYDAQRSVLQKSGKAFVEASQKIVGLEAKQTEQQNRIADLERQLESARASRSRGGVRLLAPDRMGADFWRHLANCEDREGNDPGGFFQFMGDTRTKVGWVPGLSYERQREMAIWWAEQIHPNEATTSGWPECWNKALHPEKWGI